MKSLVVWTFFGAGANKLQDELDFGDAAPFVVEVFCVEQHPAFSDATAKQIRKSVILRRNQAADALTA